MRLVECDYPDAIARLAASGSTNAEIGATLGMCFMASTSNLLMIFMAVEMASLNLDHNWGGPSLGWCERVWLQDEALWVRYIDLDPDTVELVRSKRYTRRSAEIASAIGSHTTSSASSSWICVSPSTKAIRK